MVSQVRMTCKHYEIIAELIGKAKDLDEFYRLFVKFAQTDNAKFSTEKFYNAVQKAHQFGKTKLFDKAFFEALAEN